MTDSWTCAECGFENEGYATRFVVHRFVIRFAQSGTVRAYRGAPPPTTHTMTDYRSANVNVWFDFRQTRFPIHNSVNEYTSF